MTSRILPLFALLLAIGIFFGYVSPLWNGKVASTKAAIVEDTAALAAATRYTARQNQLASEKAAIDPAALARLEIFLPDSVDNVGLILDINALAARSGLALSSIDVAHSNASGSGAGTAPGMSGAPVTPGMASSGASAVGTVDLTLAADGTYSALQTFLDGIERSARLLDVRDLTVKGSNNGVYTYQMTLRIYWLR